MYPYTKDIAEAREAMDKARIALFNLHNKFQTNGLPFAIANELELDLKNLLSTVTVVDMMANAERLLFATATLQAAGYKVIEPQE
jgi:hypothetical protein